MLSILTCVSSIHKFICPSRNFIQFQVKLLVLSKTEYAWEEPLEPKKSKFARKELEFEFPGNSLDTVLHFILCYCVGGKNSKRRKYFILSYVPQKKNYSIQNVQNMFIL
jgi:hypothetical protein